MKPSAQHLQILDPSNTYENLNIAGDHYDGLTDQFSGPGLIHCTSVTARLLVHCLGVKSELIKSYEIGDTAEACGARVTFLSANHCPGSALLLFKLASGAIYLHTGDMRACKAMESYPELAAARGNIEKVLCPPHRIRAMQKQTLRNQESRKEGLVR